MSQSQPPVDRDDLPFRHFSAKHRLVAWISQNLFDRVTYTAHHGLIAGMKRKGGLGWLPVRPEPTAEQRFWAQLDLRGFTIYDVGAFQGLLTLFFARQAKEVISYEPNTKNHARLLENLQLNGVRNVVVRKLGIGSHRYEATLRFQPLMPGGGSLEPKVGEAIAHSAHATEEISITTLDDDIRENRLPAPDFIKIDIEGFESEALRGAQQTLSLGPALFLEMHGETMNEKRRKVAEIVTLLEQAGYREIHHVESGSTITSANTAIAAEGHLYCPRRKS